MQSFVINADLKNKNYNNYRIQQGYSVPIKVIFTDNGKYFDVTNYEVSIEMIRGEKFIIQTNDIQKENNVVTCVVDKTFTQVAGTSQMQIYLKKDGEVTGSWVIDWTVLPSVISEKTTSCENVITAKNELDTSILQAQEFLNRNPNLGEYDRRLQTQEQRLNGTQQTVTSLSQNVQKNSGDINSINSSIASVNSRIQNNVNSINQANEEIKKRAYNMTSKSDITPDQYGRNETLVNMGNGIHIFTTWFRIEPNGQRTYSLPRGAFKKFVMSPVVTVQMPDGDYNTWSRQQPVVTRWALDSITLANFDNNLPVVALITIIGAY